MRLKNGVFGTCSVLCAVGPQSSCRQSTGYPPPLPTLSEILQATSQSSARFRAFHAHSATRRAARPHQRTDGESVLERPHRRLAWSTCAPMRPRIPPCAPESETAIMGHVPSCGDAITAIRAPGGSKRKSRNKRPRACDHASFAIGCLPRTLADPPGPRAAPEMGLGHGFSPEQAKTAVSTDFAINPGMWIERIASNMLRRAPRPPSAAPT